MTKNTKRQAALVDRVVQPQPPSTSALLMQGRGAPMEMQVDFDNFEGASAGSHQGAGDGAAADGEEGGEGIRGDSEGVTGRHRPVTGRDLLQVDLDVLERGLREVVPFLCAYLRGHTEVRMRTFVGLVVGVGSCCCCLGVTQCVMSYSIGVPEICSSLLCGSRLRVIYVGMQLGVCCCWCIPHNGRGLWSRLWVHREISVQDCWHGTFDCYQQRVCFTGL